MTMNDRTIDVYDDVPYQGLAIRLSHPCHLAMVARLSGLKPPPPTRCRVLELGCAVGSNLLPMAEGLPESRFVGIDLSSRQIDEARTMQHSAGLDNAELHHLDILDVDERIGTFDYIICHGVYSWVQPEIQAHILDIGTRLLADNGLMYVSYNANPGWRLRGVVREMLLWHVAGLSTANDKIEQARGLIKFLADAAMPLRASYGALLKEEAEAIASASNHNLFHDQLEGTNDALYFHEFAQHVETHGLTYVADADIGTLFAQHFDSATEAMLMQVPPLRREQYMDFLRGRIFRRSILRRPECVPDGTLSSSSALIPMHVRLSVPLEPTGRKGENTVWSHGGASLTSTPAMSILLERLRQRGPAWTCVRDLIEESGGVGAANESIGRLLNELLAAMSYGAIAAADEPPAVASEVSLRPHCSPLARVMAQQGDWVVNRHHESIRLDDLSLFLVERLNGSRNRLELAQIIEAALANGELRLPPEGANVSRPDRQACIKIVDKALSLLASQALLIG